VAPVEPTLAREAAAWAEGRLLIGVDEVGRGPLAGPVVAAAAVFPSGITPIPGVRDSKTLSAAQRRRLLAAILSSVRQLALGAASVAEIDRLNIRVATALAMHRAIRRLVAGLRGSAARSSGLPAIGGELRLLLDGLPVAELGYPHEALVDGDAHCYTIAAAGIVAKSVRDGLMLRLSGRHPGYGWETNAGYGTAHHCDALAALGPTRHHRRSFAPISQFFLPIG